MIERFGREKLEGHRRGMEGGPTVMRGKFGPYFVRCYYCGQAVTEETHGWNAKKDGKLWLVHNRCMNSEEEAIRASGDWKRGEEYRTVHILTNPLAEATYKAGCGCEISLLKDSPEGPYHFASMHRFCWRHRFHYKYIGLYLMDHIKYFRKYSRFYSFVDKKLREQKQFKIYDRYLEGNAAKERGKFPYLIHMLKWAIRDTATEIVSGHASNTESYYNFIVTMRALCRKHSWIIPELEEIVREAEEADSKVRPYIQK